jgi:hypothetical protein
VKYGTLVARIKSRTRSRATKRGCIGVCLFLAGFFIEFVNPSLPLGVKYCYTQSQSIASSIRVGNGTPYNKLFQPNHYKQ